MSTKPSLPIEAPNLFILAGHGVSVTIALSGFDGQPHVTYHDALRALSFSGAEITIEECSLGRLVTVTILTTVDVGATTFSIALPNFNLIGGHHQVSTFGVTALHRTTLGGIGRGQLTTYTTVHLYGTAEQVEF